MKIVFLTFLSMFVIDGVFGVDADGVKTVIEGDSLTVQTGFTEMQKDGLTEWTFNNTNIATINKGTGKVEFSDDKLMMMFSGRLNLDQTGFLTIWNIRIKHSGEYKVESVSSVGTKSKTFKVIVKESPLKSVEDKDEIKVLSATKGSSETLHTETELQKHDLILWRFGAEGSLIAKADTEDNHTSYYDGDDGRFKGRLEMDSETGSLTITDLETEHTGEFRLKIISDRGILFKRFTVSVSVLGLSPGAVAGICVVVLLLVAAAAVAAGVMIYCRRDHFKLKNLMSKVSKQLEQMSKMTKRLDQMTKTNEKDLAKISEQINKMDEANVSENEKKELYGKLKQMSEDYEKALPEISKQLERLCEQKIPERLFKLSEQVNQMNEPETSQQETCADVPQEETPRSEIRDGERERFIVVEETAISKVLGADKILRDSRGRKSIAIRAEDEEVQTHGSDGESPGNELKEDEPETSQQETYTDVPQEETPRSEIRDGERERFIVVEETAISKVLGADKILRDSRGRKSIAIRAEDEEVQTHDDVKISEQETRADVTQEETPRSEIREGEREQIIYVEETAISKVLGADKRLKDRQGKKSIVIRKANTEDTGVQTHGSDGKVPENELKEESTGKEVNEETPFMSQKEEDGSNE